MKPTKPFILNWMLAGMLALGTGFAGCTANEGDALDATQLFRATGSGAQERPTPVITTGSGSLSGRYAPEIRQFSYTLSWNRLSAPPIAMHFHGPADPNTAAGVVLPITGFPTRVSGSVSNTVTLTPEQAQQLTGGLWYFNIHTNNFPAGEIRGQVLPGR